MDEKVDPVYFTERTFWSGLGIVCVSIILMAILTAGPNNLGLFVIIVTNMIVCSFGFSMIGGYMESRHKAKAECEHDYGYEFVCDYCPKCGKYIGPPEAQRYAWGGD